MLGDFFFRLFFLSLLVVTSVVIHAQDDQSGFISIDCGITEGSNYTDSTTGILYSSDAGYVDTGVSMTVPPGYRTDSILVQQFLTLRSFPEGTRNCYNLRPSQGKNNKYLIRLRFLYGNYDRQNRLPVFDVHIGVEYWTTVSFDEESDLMRREIIHIPTRDYINICFINTGRGTPFVSALELRPLPNTIYKTVSGSLNYILRWDFGSTAPDYLRYSADRYDRMWMPHEVDNTITLNALSDVEYNNFYIPSQVMNTAITPQDASESLRFAWNPNNITSDQYYFYAYFAEVDVRKPDESRSFNIYLNENHWFGPHSLPNISSDVIGSISPTNCSGNLLCELKINRTENSTLPPLINALEVYQLLQFSEPGTDENDIEGIMNIKSAYNLAKNWQGDPCAPKDHVWDGVNCSYDISNSLRIISLDLSSSGLTGWIAFYINDLKKLHSLDLSNNNLTGHVPDFLSQMNSLRVLKLKGNNFTGPIPAELVDKSNAGMLSLSIDGLSNNTNPCQSPPCVRKESIKKALVVPVVASVVAGLFGLLAIVFVFRWMVKRRKQRQDPPLNANPPLNADPAFAATLETKNKSFTYSEVLKITNNFERVIGQGGFGIVYHGYDGETQVAVKMLSPSSIQGYKEFQAEVSLLVTVHHKNLTRLVGYCNEGTNMGIIYEYMANGNLQNHILDRNLYVISWEERIQIAIDAAQGLEYLHHGCKPPIMHRDVKLSNILLNENFQAKVADFGLSRMFLIEGDSHVSTRVAGTPGYLDPEYYTSSRLTEKSDVYSFGIVLLEIVAGRPTIVKSHDKTHIVQWVSSMLQNGDVMSIIDPRLKEEFDVNSVWKVVELAMACASLTSTKRPTMNYVVMELKECLAVEMAHRSDSKDSIGLMTLNVESGLGPQTR